MKCFITTIAVCTSQHVCIGRSFNAAKLVWKGIHDPLDSYDQTIDVGF